MPQYSVQSLERISLDVIGQFGFIRFLLASFSYTMASPVKTRIISPQYKKAKFRDFSKCIWIWEDFPRW
jgi:hypothetical protein